MAKHIVAFICLMIIAGKGLALEETSPCLRELEINFFKYETTAQAFSMHRIGQSQWSTIVSQLQSASQQVPQLVSEQAKQLNPNPLVRPFQPQIAAILLKRALFVVFRQVLLQNYVTVVTNEVAIREMFEHIWSVQRRNIVNCLGVDALGQEKVTE